MLELRDVTYRYGENGRPAALRQASLEVAPGEAVGLLGRNGSGKSTLLRCACAQLVPQGGAVAVDGLSSGSDGWRRGARRAVGIVGQDPDDQMVSTTLFEEVAFGPCNLGLPRRDVEELVGNAMALCGLEGLGERDVGSLSGGQRQRAAIAGVLAMRPSYLLLDEACSMLDASDTARVLELARSVAGAGGGVVLATHELEEALGLDRVAVMEEGRVIWSGAPAALLSDEGDVIARSGCRVSPWAACARELLRRGLLPQAAPLSDPEGCAALLEGDARGIALDAAARAAEAPPLRRAAPGERGAGRPGIEVASATLAFRSGKAVVARALDHADLSVAPGEAVCLVGANGAGKTTLARVAAGLLEPDSGSASVCGRKAAPGSVAFVPQRAEDQLFADTVMDDVEFGPRNRGATRPQAREAAVRALLSVGLDPAETGALSPFALSGGQMRRAALAGALALGAPFLVLDEPTVGLDAPGVSDLARAVGDLRGRGVGVLVVTHDLAAGPLLAERAVAMEGGRTVWDGPLGGLWREGAAPASIASLGMLARFARALGRRGADAAAGGEGR